MAYSKRTSAKIKNARSVTSAAATHGSAVASELDRLLGLDPGTVARVLAGLGTALSSATKTLDERELELAREAGDDNAVLTARDEAHSATRSAIGKARALVLAFVGADQRKALGLDAEIPETASELNDYARRTADALARAGLNIEIGAGVTVQSPVLGDNVATHASKLDLALKNVETEVRELSAALGARDLSLGPWARAYRGVATTLTGLFILAGRDDLADRVRPTERRARGEEEVDEPAPEPTPT